MRTNWGKAALVAAVSAMFAAMPATAAATPDYTWVIGGGAFNVEQNTKVTLDVTNLSGETISVTADATLGSMAKVLTPGGEVAVVTPVCSVAACHVTPLVLSTSPDVIVSATMTLDGNTQESYIAPNDFIDLGPQGTPAGMLAQVAGTSGVLATLQSTVTSIQTTLGGVGGQIASVQSAAGGLSSQVGAVAGTLGGVATASTAAGLGDELHSLTTRVDALTHSLKRLSDALLPKHKKKTKKSSSHH